MKNIILVTSKFPYGYGEQFLETEIKYFTNHKNIDLTILPTSNEGIKRELPSSIAVDNSLLLQTSNSIPSRLLYFIKSLNNPVFYRELFSENLLHLTKIKYFLLSLSRYQMFYELLDKILNQQKNLNDTIIYTYWHNEATYALQSLKNKYHFTLISRTHGGDTYRQSRPMNYMPLKKHFTSDIDKIFTITPSAITYLSKTYKFDENILELSRLGVNDHNIRSLPSDKNSFNIVSCSFLVEVKQIHKIIETLVILSETLKDIQIKWTHIGNGILYDTLLTLAEQKLSHLANIDFNFVGKLSNSDVYEFYKKNEVDVFLNVSESEGVPVSIMEAMSCHIPIVAPDVGGITDILIHQMNGCLLSSLCTVDEIVSSLKNINFLKKREIRDNSYGLYLEKYNAKTNYVNFIETLSKL